MTGRAGRDAGDRGVQLPWRSPQPGYFPLINGEVRLPYAVGPREVTFAVEAPSRPAAISRPYAEYTLGAVFLRTRHATNQRFRLVRVEFSHPRPADTREHERLFDCHARFGAEACRLVIARDAWDTPRAGGDAALFSVLDAHASVQALVRPDAHRVPPRGGALQL